MQQYNPFQMSLQAGNRASESIKAMKDQMSLDNILSQAMKSNNPDVLQNTIGQIISKVSPERQAAAVSLIQNRIQGIEGKRKEDLKNQAYQKEFGEGSQYLPEGYLKDKKAYEYKQQTELKDRENKRNKNISLAKEMGINLPSDIDAAQLTTADLKAMKPSKQQISDYDKIRSQKQAADVYKTENEDLPRYKSSQQNITHLKNLAKKLTGPLGYGKALFNTSEAAEFNTLGASLLEPVIKVFNPTGALPTAKLNWIKDQFQPRASELSSTIAGKISTMERLNNQAIQRAEDKIKLYHNFNGNPPASEVMKFDQESDKFINDFVDKEILKDTIIKETPKGKVAMLDPDGKPLHVDPNAIAPNGKSLIEFYIENGAKLLNE